MTETHKISIIHTHTHTYTHTHTHTYIYIYVYVYIDDSRIVELSACKRKVSSERYNCDDINTGAHNFTFLSCAKETTVGHNDV